MNERIRQLALQATSYADTLDVADQRIYQEIRDREFAALVAEREREECAKVADRQNGDDEQDLESCVWSKAARHIAAAIRARGSK